MIRALAGWHSSTLVPAVPPSHWLPIDPLLPFLRNFKMRINKRLNSHAKSDTAGCVITRVSASTNCLETPAVTANTSRQSVALHSKDPDVRSAVESDQGSDAFYCSQTSSLVSRSGPRDESHRRCRIINFTRRQGSSVFVGPRMCAICLAVRNTVARQKLLPVSEASCLFAASLYQAEVRGAQSISQLYL
jgi:hypothetical protein